MITGGLGFIGSNLALSLIKAGACVSLLGNSWPVDDSHLDPVLKSLKFWPIDLCDGPRVQQAVEGVDIIFNLAARSGAVKSNQSPLEDMEKNCAAQLAFLEACRLRNPSVKVVYTSSRLVYSQEVNLPASESEPTDPITFYGVHKLMIEKYHHLYHRLYGINSVVARITNPYGPHQRRGMRGYGIINWFIQLAVDGESLPVYGDGKQLRDYIYIDDVVNALMILGIDARANNKVFNLGSGIPLRFIDMATEAIRLAGSGSIKHIPWPESASKTETGDYYSDIYALQSSVGWSPQVTFTEGMNRVISYYRTNKGSGT